MVTKLTKTQLKVLRLRYEGLKNKEIAEKLGVSEPDVSQTLSRIANKLVSIQDVLASMKDLDLIERDIEIELTEQGKAFFKDWQKAKIPRVKKAVAKPMSITKVIISGSPTAYTGFEPQLHENIELGTRTAKTLRDMAEKLSSISVEITQGIRPASSYMKEEELKPKRTLRDRNSHMYV